MFTIPKKKIQNVFVKSFCQKKYPKFFAVNVDVHVQCEWQPVDLVAWCKKTSSEQNLCRKLSNHESYMYKYVNACFKFYHLNLAAALSLVLPSSGVSPRTGRRPWIIRCTANIWMFCNTCPPAREDDDITPEITSNTLICQKITKCWDLLLNHKHDDGAMMKMMWTVMSLGEQQLTFCTKKQLTLFSTILWAHFSKLSSSPDILLTGLAPEAFDKDDLPSRVFTESGRLNPVVPTCNIMVKYIGISALPIPKKSC